MDYSQIQAFFTVLLGICGMVVGVSGMVAVVIRFWKWAHKDSMQNAEEIDAFKHETEMVRQEYRDWFASDKRRIETLERRQDETEEMNRLQLEALFTLLGHEIDGNHTAQLEKVRGKINGYLIKKVGGTHERVPD